MKGTLLKITMQMTFMLCSTISIAQTIHYVDSSRPDNSGIGTSWSTAKRDLQVAVTAAISGDVIWVKAGTYLPTHDPFGNTSPADNRDKTFTLKNGVKIYGGFAGTETLLSERNWTTNKTILSGELGNTNSLTDNAYHVVISVNLSNTTVLDGVVITKGYATAPGASTLTISGRILERYNGGGIFNSFSATSFSNCSITFNSADCTDTDNDSMGAGIVNNNCSSSFSNCIIDSNSFLVGGGSFGVFGAGMIILNGSCSISSCIFSNNTSGSGFIDASRGGALNVTGTVTIANTVFYNNSAQNGAALQFGGADGNLSTITNCTFANNTSSFAGTAYQGFSKATFKNCLFWDNNPTASGVAGRNEIYSQDDRVGFQPTFENCIIRDAVGSPLAIPNSVLLTCLTSNPLFVNAPDGDGLDNRWATPDDGLILQGASPAKNSGATGSGIPTTDIIGNIRDSQPDLGAYEYQNPCIIPTAFNVNGGGAYCEGGTGQVILLLGSEIGVTYQLKNGSATVGTPINGTGNAISYGNQTVAGTYTIQATRTLDGCSSLMTGSATITITPNIAPTFTPVNAICAGGSLSALPLTSNNGITGGWSPALLNTETTVYTFIPNTGQCATTAELTITVNPNITPTFIQAPPICSGELLPALPTISGNDIIGTWAPELDNTRTTTYTFTPATGQCATTAEQTITVNPNVTPAFTPVAPICLGAALSDLPVTSNNGVSGSWSPNIDNTQTTTYTFRPLSEQCAVETDLTITVNVTNAPTGLAMQDACSTGTLSDLQVNGTAITWYSTPTSSAVLPLSTILVNGTVYYASQTVSGCESLDRLAVAATGPCLNVETHSDILVNYAPNPVRNLLTITGNEMISSYYLLNSLGQMLATENINRANFEIDMSALPSGSYLIKLASDRKFKILKIVKR